MPTVTEKKKRPSDDTPPRKGKGADKPRYPSRENLRYVALPKALHEALERYASDNSDEDDTKSISWAARKAVRRFLESEGYWPPSGSEG